MLYEELRHPWALSLIAGLCLVAFIVLYDRLRMPPYAWPENEQGLALTIEELAHRPTLGENRDWTHNPMQQIGATSAPLSSTAEVHMPAMWLDRNPYDRPNEHSPDPLSMDARSWKAIEVYLAHYKVEEKLVTRFRDQLWQVHRPPHPAAALALTAHLWRGDQHQLQQLAYCGMLHRLRSGHTEGALRSLKAMASVSLVFLWARDMTGFRMRMECLDNAQDAAEVLVAAEELDLRQWAVLLAGQLEPRGNAATLVSDARRVLEAEGTRALEWYQNAADALYFSRTYEQPALYERRRDVWFLPQEVAASSAIALLGVESLDKAILVRAAVDNRDFYQPGRESWYSRTTAFVPYSRHYGAQAHDGRYWGGLWPSLIAWPRVALAAAVVDLHRREHGVWPASLDHISAEVVEELLQEIGRQRVLLSHPEFRGELSTEREHIEGHYFLTEQEEFELERRTAASAMGGVDEFFDDPYGEGRIVYRPTTRGVVLYSIGPNEFDNGHLHEPTKRAARQAGVAFPKPTTRQQDIAQKQEDDILFELLDERHIATGN